MRAASKLIATYSRAVYSGVAETFNLAFRRLQLAAAQRLRPFHSHLSENLILLNRTRGLTRPLAPPALC